MPQIHPHSYAKTHYFNSTISDLGTLVTSRDPSDRNTFGTDIDRTNAPSGVVANGATSATVVITTGGEQYYPHVLTTAFDLYVPVITPNVVKTVADVNGGALAPGDTLRWTISLSNTGIDTGTNVILKDPIPANTTYAPGSLNIVSGANAGVKSDTAAPPANDQAEFSVNAAACAPVTAPCVIFRLGTGATDTLGGSLPFGASTSITFDTTVNAGVTSGTMISNTASISYSGQTLGSTFSTTSAAASMTVLAPPLISKSFSASPIAINGTSVLSIVVSSPLASPSNMTGVSFTDNYPQDVGGNLAADLLNTATPNPAVSCTPGSAAGTLTGGAAGGASIGMTGATLAPGGSCTVTVNVTSAVAGNYLNTTGNVTSTSSGTGGTASATLAVGTPSIAKAFAPASIVTGGTSVITFTLNNPTAVALSAVGFTDTLSSMQVAGTPAVTNTCGGAVSATAGATGANAITLTGGSLAPNSSCTVSVTVTSSTTGVLPNTTSGVTSSAPTGLPSNTANLTVIGSPVATKSFSPTSIRTNALGGVSTLTITITNPNTTTNLTGVAFTDNLPQNVGGVAAADMFNTAAPNPTLNCSIGSSATLVGGAASGATIGISAGTLLSGGSCTVTVQVTGGAAANYLNSTGAITTTVAGLPSGAASTATLNVTALTPPTVAKSFTASNIAIGGTTTMTITLTNPQAILITGAAFTDNYPPGLFNDLTPAAATTCNAGGATPAVTAAASGTSLSLSGGGIPASASCTITVTVTSSTPGPMLNTIPIGGVTTTNAAANTALASATLTALAPPTITKSFNPSAIGVDVGDFSTMTIVVSNPIANGVNLTGVNFSDPYPQDVGGVAAADMVNAPTPALTNTCTGTGSVAGTMSGTAAGNTTLGMTGATIAPGGACTITISVRGGAAASYVNTTGNVAATGPIALTGSNASATLTVGRPGITKAFGTSPILAGATSVMTITLVNGTSVAMTAAAFTDTYPATMTNSGAPATTCGGTVSAPTTFSVALTGGTIPANSTCTVTVTVTATSTTINTIAIGALNSSAGTNATAATATLVVTPPLTVVKSFAPARIAPGVTSVLTITLTNPNNFAVTGVQFTDSYPQDVGGNSAADIRNAATPAGATTCTAGTVTAAANGTSLVFGTGTTGTVPANSSCTITVNVTVPVPVSGSVSGSYINNTGAVTSTNGGTAPSVSAILTVLNPPTITKLMSVISDPINGTFNPKAIPGAIVEYNVLVTNLTLAHSVNTVMIVDAINANLSLFVNDLSGGGSGPVAFTQGAVSSGLTYTYTSAASAADDLEFFNATSGGTRITSFTPNAAGCDAAVRRIEINPKGIFASGDSISPQPSFVLRFRACIK